MSDITVGQVGELIAQAKAGRVTRENLQVYLRNPDGFVAGGRQYLRLISDKPLVIGSTDGSEVLAEASGMFAYIDPDIKNWKADEPGVATGETPTLVYEMTRDATFAQMFGELSSDVAKLCLTQAQIKAFVNQHRDWLRKDSYATFFLFKSYDQFFVVGVRVGSGGGLWVGVCRFEGDDVWHAESRHRLVVPQLA